jgi:phosphonate transport system substrate-binding protein
VPIRQLEYFSQRNKIEADSTVSDTDKKTRIAEIDKKLAELK